MLTKSVLISISLSFLCLISCKKEKENIPPTSFYATIDGQEYEFKEASILIKTRGGIPETRKIVAHYTEDESDDLLKTIYIYYLGDLEVNNPDAYETMSGIYYENSFNDSWSWICRCEEFQIKITQKNNNKVSGTVSDFIASGDKGEIELTNIKFTSIPIETVELGQHPTHSN